MGFETQSLQAWRQQFEEVLGTVGCWFVEWRVARPVDGQWWWRIHAAIRRIRTDADQAACFPPLSVKEEPRLVVHELDERVQRARDGAKEAGIQVGAPDVPSPNPELRAERDAEQEVQTEVEELRDEEPEAEEERKAKRPRCWSSMENGAETATGM